MHKRPGKTAKKARQERAIYRAAHPNAPANQIPLWDRNGIVFMGWVRSKGVNF